MDKQAFKQRMQNLKSYRENNPDKGYWDWRNSLPDNLKYTDDTEYNMRGAYESGAQPTLENDGFYHLPTRNPQTGEILKTSLHPTFWKGLTEDAKMGYNTYFVGDKVYTKSKEEGPINAYADGGEVARKSLKDIRKESIIEDKLDYDVMLQNQNAYQKEFATNWYKERAKNPKYSSQLGDGKLDKILSDIDKATWKNPTEAMRDNLISQGYTPTDQNIKSQLQAINTKLGRTPDGRPKEQGLKPVFDLEDAANITPIGDALSARDVYNAVTEKDWTGAGLAALGILPFIPSGLRQLKSTARYIPSVSRSRE